MQITALFVYPIKGCRAIALESADVDPVGIAGDRRFMLVDADNRFLSQRSVPTLATLVPELTADGLRVGAAGLAPFDLARMESRRPRAVRVWSEHVIDADDQGDAAADWFSTALGVPCRLVRFGASASNPIDPEYAPRPGLHTSFTDGYPMLGVLEESLDDLNQLLATPVPMARFRPSVVLRGALAWSEDVWQTLRFPDLACDAVKPCERCVVTTTDQMTGYRDSDQEPLRTLAKFRTVPGLGAMFGQNLIPRGEGRLHVGDEVVIT